MNAEFQPASFKLIGGALCLNFTNTTGGWVLDSPLKGVRDVRYRVLREKLNTYADLIEWCKSTGLLSGKEARSLFESAEAQPAVATTVLARALNLRETLYNIFTSVIDGRRPRPVDLEALNAELLIARSHERLARAAEGFVLEWDQKSSALDFPLWAVAQSAAELLISAELSQVRWCGGCDCGWLFLDTSRNRSRQWCDMKVCGNLAKVRRFRERRQQQG